VLVLKPSRQLKTFTITDESTKRFGARGSPADHPLQKRLTRRHLDYI
jgi:hypothetical protein